jgi:hypothetical protein
MFLTTKYKNLYIHFSYDARINLERIYVNYPDRAGVEYRTLRAAKIAITKFEKARGTA